MLMALFPVNTGTAPIANVLAPVAVDVPFDSVVPSVTHLFLFVMALILVLLNDVVTGNSCCSWHCSCCY